MILGQEPKQHVLGNDIVLQVVWTDPVTRLVQDDLPVQAMTCYVRHTDDADAIEAGDVVEGSGIAYEATFRPTRTGMYYYAFIYDGPPRALKPGMFEVIGNEVNIA